VRLSDVPETSVFGRIKPGGLNGNRRCHRTSDLDFPLALIMLVPLFAPGWLSADEVWLIWGPPAWVMLPFSAALWWITIRRVVFRRPGGFIIPWVMWLLAAGLVVLWRWTVTS
jgi:hypothetical protein